MQLYPMVLASLLAGAPAGPAAEKEDAPPQETEQGSQQPLPPARTDIEQSGLALDQPSTPGMP